MANKLAVVSVIVMGQGNLNSVTSFADDDEGNKAAEALFEKNMTDFAQKDGWTPDADDLYCASGDGHYEDTNGVEMFLTHSETV